MNKFSISKIILFLFLTVVGFYLLFPFVSNAALVPCGKSTDTGNDAMCDLCHLIIGIKGLIDYGFIIFIVLGLVMLVVAGVVYIVSSGNEGMMETAKGLLKNALIGFAIILGAWLIINVALRVISAQTNLGVTQATNWWTFTCATKQ
jgi:hypothetical protein